MSNIAGDHNEDRRSTALTTSVSPADDECSPPSDPPPPSASTQMGSTICSTLVTLDLSNRLRNLGRFVSCSSICALFHWPSQVSKYLPLVGCCNDDTTHKFKGKTVMDEQERNESLRHCKWVDEVIPDTPWVINQEFLDKHWIAYVAHDALPYADAGGAGKDVYEFVKKVGTFKETKRTEGISTSDIIMRIVKDYNQYVMRNLARGYSREDLGFSFVMAWHHFSTSSFCCFKKFPSEESILDMSTCNRKRRRANMRLKKLQEKVKEQQEKVGEKGTAIRDRIQEKLMRQEAKELRENGQNGQHEDTKEQFYEEYYFEHDTDK